MGEIVLISHCNLLNVFSLMWSLSLFFLVGKGLCQQRENFFIEIKIEKSSPCLREGPHYFKINIIKLLLKQCRGTRVFHPWEDSRRVGKRFAGGLARLVKPPCYSAFSIFHNLIATKLHHMFEKTLYEGFKRQRQFTNRAKNIHSAFLGSQLLSGLETW